MLKRVNQQIRRRMRIIRVFPDTDTRFRLMRDLTVKIHEDWQEVQRYLNMRFLKEPMQESLKESRLKRRKWPSPGPEEGGNPKSRRAMTQNKPQKIRDA